MKDTRILDRKDEEQIIETSLFGQPADDASLGWGADELTVAIKIKYWKLHLKSWCWNYIWRLLNSSFNFLQVLKFCNIGLNQMLILCKICAEIIEFSGISDYHSIFNIITIYKSYQHKSYIILAHSTDFLQKCPLTVAEPSNRETRQLRKWLF